MRAARGIVVAVALAVTGCGGGSVGTAPVTARTPLATLTSSAPAPAHSRGGAHSARPRHHHRSSPRPSVTSAAPTTMAPQPATTTPAPTASPTRQPSRSPSPSATKSSPSPCAATSQHVALSMEDDPSHPSTPYRFSSSSISIGCGGSVDITNKSTAPHTFSPQHGGFADSGNINPKASTSVRFNFRGTFGFYCAYHGWMTGKVTVN